MDESIDIEALKKDEQFLADVKMLEEEVKNSDSVAKAYRLLDVKLALNEDEEGINELFQKIVNGAFTNIAIAIENGKKLDISNAEDFATMRGIYEYAMQAYSENLTKQAQELFLALHHTTDDFELKDAFMVHAAAVGKGYSFEDFINKLTKMDENRDFSDPKALFITDFVQPVDILLEMMKDEVEKLEKRLDKLKGEG